MKESNPPDAEQELSSQERLVQTILGLKIPPSTENLAEELAAAQKRMDAYERGD